MLNDITHYPEWYGYISGVPLQSVSPYLSGYLYSSLATSTKHHLTYRTSIAYVSSISKFLEFLWPSPEHNFLGRTSPLTFNFQFLTLLCRKAFKGEINHCTTQCNMAESSISPQILKKKVYFSLLQLVFCTIFSNNKMGWWYYCCPDLFERRMR